MLDFELLMAFLVQKKIFANYTLNPEVEYPDIGVA